MSNDLLAQGILLGMSSFGIVIEKWEGNTLYISVPKDTTDYRDESEKLAGKKLADRVQTKLRDLGCMDIRIKFRLRDEIWTEEKRKSIL